MGAAVEWAIAIIRRYYWCGLSYMYGLHQGHALGSCFPVATPTAARHLSMQVMKLPCLLRKRPECILRYCHHCQGLWYPHNWKCQFLLCHCQKILQSNKTWQRHWWHFKLIISASHFKFGTCLHTISHYWQKGSCSLLSYGVQGKCQFNRYVFDRHQVFSWWSSVDLDVEKMNMLKNKTNTIWTKEWTMWMQTIWHQSIWGNNWRPSLPKLKSMTLQTQDGTSSIFGIDVIAMMKMMIVVKAIATNSVGCCSLLSLV